MAAANVELAGAQTASIEVDLSHLIAGRVEGLVLQNGTPLAQEDRLYMVKEGSVPDAAGVQHTDPVRIVTDTRGRFAAHARGGRPTLVWTRYVRRVRMEHRAGADAPLTAGGRVKATFHFRTAQLRLRVLDAAGAPVPGVALLLGDAADPGRHRPARTDRDGWTEALVEAAPLDLHALVPGSDPPRHLHPATLAPSMGEEVTRELRLPPEWPR